MNEFALISLIGVLPILGFVYLRHLRYGPECTLWAWAWVILYLSGFANSFDLDQVALHAGSRILGSLFPALVLAGAYYFSQRDPPRWVVPAGVALGCARALLHAIGFPQLSYLSAVPAELPFTLGAVIVVWRASGHTPLGSPARLLAGALALLAAINALDPVVRTLGGTRTPLLVGWVFASVSIAILQILAVVERLRQQERAFLLEREGAARETARERRIQRAVLDAVPIGICFADTRNRMLLANRDLLAQLAPEDGASVIGRDALELTEAAAPRFENAEQLIEIGRRAKEDPDHVVDNVELDLGAQGSWVLYSAPVTSDSGTPLGRVWIARNVTEERRLQSQLREAHKMETVGTLAGGIAHDFNNQLTVILSNARLALEETEDRPLAREGLLDLERAAQHCARLTRGLLAFARRTPADFQYIDLRNLLGEVERLLRASLPSTIDLEIRHPPDLRWVRADATQLEQVLLNLALNARDALPGAGRIEITAECYRLEPEQAARHPEAHAGRFVEIRVVDDGAGMPASVRERIFDPFFTTKPVGQGTGLGLAIAYGAVRAHGGWIEVESEPGAGTAFSVFLPEAEDEHPDAGAGETSTAGGGRETILIADDEPAVRRVVRSTLEPLGYTVLEARDGEQAVERFLERPGRIDLVLLDLTMPRRDGLRALAAMREVRPSLPAILASGHFHTPGLDLPTDDVETLPKPFSPAALAKAVRTLLDAAGGAT